MRVAFIPSILACLTTAFSFQAHPTHLAHPTHPTDPAHQICDMAHGNVAVAYDLTTGTANLSWSGVPTITGFYSAVCNGGVSTGGADDVCDGTYLTSRDYVTRTCTTSGNVTDITLTDDDKPTMVQEFRLESDNHVMVDVRLLGDGLSSNWMAPLVVDTSGGVDIGSYGDVRALQVPYDNDHGRRYNAMSINSSGISYEVGAFYDNVSRAGLVVGSVTHDTWKTGVRFSGSNNRLDSLRVFGGAADDKTQDCTSQYCMPHGAITGDVLQSPTVLVGLYGDWRDGLEDFADGNTAVAPRLPWNGGVPFGWNSWGSIKSGLSYPKAIQVSDFFANALPDFRNAQGVVYINLDSFWDNLKHGDDDSELADFVAHAHANGQKAGIYYTPWACCWGSNPNLSATVAGSTYTYNDIVMRTSEGSPIKVDNGLAVDPTHPGARDRMAFYIARFQDLGFEYIKLDFLSHGAIEGGSNNGVHDDPAVQTAMQAYNQGMQYLLDLIGGTMFISESIAPIFPYQYAHSRRLATDTFGSIGHTSYEMNSASYGWWMGGRLYSFNDPDQLVMEGFTQNENKSRIMSGVVSGLFLDGDDVTDWNPPADPPIGQDLARHWLGDFPEVIAVARLGLAFRPVEGNTGTSAASVLVAEHASTSYLAVFNYNGSSGATRTIDLARAGLNGSTVYTVTDLWTGTIWTASGQVEITLGPAESTLLRLR